MLNCWLEGGGLHFCEVISALLNFPPGFLEGEGAARDPRTSGHRESIIWRIIILQKDFDVRFVWFMRSLHRRIFIRISACLNLIWEGIRVEGLPAKSDTAASIFRGGVFNPKLMNYFVQFRCFEFSRRMWSIFIDSIFNALPLRNGERWDLQAFTYRRRSMRAVDLVGSNFANYVWIWIRDRP